MPYRSVGQEWVGFYNINLFSLFFFFFFFFLAINMIYDMYYVDLKPIFHQNAKYLASGTFASPNAKDSTSVYF